MDHSLSLAKDAATLWLEFSELALLLFGLLLVVGLMGEAAKSEKWKARHRIFEILVIIGVAGELLADGGIFGFSKRLQVISDQEIAGLNLQVAGLNLQA